MASGGTRNDIGLFGGPNGAPGPLFSGATSANCYPIVVDWDMSRVLLRHPLFFEPGGNPWDAHIRYDDPYAAGHMDIYGTPEQVEALWLGSGRLISNHILGRDRLEVITETD